MSGHNKRGFAALGTRARLAVAATVLAAGGAGGAAIAVSGSRPATTVQAAAYANSFRHTTSEQAALTMAATGWPKSPATTRKTFTTLAQMVPMRTFTQVKHQQTMIAAQRGTTEFASKHFLVVKSANRAEHVWLVSRGTKYFNAADSSIGLAAMTGGSMAAPSRMAMNAKGIAAGDLIFVVGIKEHSHLIAKLVLFVAPLGVTHAVFPTATASPTGTVSPTVTASPTATVSPTGTVSPTVTVSPTATVSPTGTVSPTVTVSPTGTVSPTVTVSPTGTATPTASASTSPVPSVSPTHQ